MACHTLDILSGLLPNIPAKYPQIKIPIDFSASGSAHLRKNVLGAFLLCVLLLFASGQFSRAWAIDVYHFLVKYKNGRVAEKIYPEPPEDYEHQFKDYVSKTRLIEKREYSVDGFIKTFGEEKYERLMTGYFGFGLEEEIIFNRQTQGLGFDSGALPPPDETSSKLLEIWNGMERKELLAESLKKAKTPQGDGPQEPQPETPKKITSSRAAVPKKSEKDGDRAARPLPEGAQTITLKTEEKRKNEAEGPPSSPPPEGEKIDVYRFLVQYINGKTVEKTATMTPEQYTSRYPGYVTKTAMVDKKSYSKSRFKKVFGEEAYSLLIQGNFGVGDMEMIMQSRSERGMPSRKDVLPKAGPESEKLSKRLEHLLKTRNFTVQGPIAQEPP
jgi:hypothetical protein